MKITISKAQWEMMGKQAGWYKQAGEDWMVNENYVIQVIEELKRRGDDILSSDSHSKVTVNHKIGDKVLHGMSIRVFEGSYEGIFILNAYGKDNQMLTMADGMTVGEAIDNMDNMLSMIISHIK